MKYKHVIHLIAAVIICGLLYSFYTINHLNYLNHRKIQAQIIDHPEGLPKAEVAQLGSFGFTNIAADLYWLQTIQYIGGNVIGEEYKKYLGVMMNLITDLNPYFESPYIIGQLLLPSTSGSADIIETPEELKNVKQGEALGLKGVGNFCDTDKVNAIIKEADLGKIVSKQKYSDPCKSYKVPYYLAYIYFFYLKDSIQAANYYKVVSAQSDAPEGAKVLAAIMQGKGGERKKSVFMFLSLAENTGGSGEACNFMSSKLRDLYTQIDQNNLPLTGNLIRDIELSANQILPRLTEENENDVLDDTKCSNYLAKAIRELNLLYIEDADARYVQDNPDKVSARNMQTLFDAGYIDFIPTDYQQYEDEGYGITYTYDDALGRFDYGMADYEK